MMSQFGRVNLSRTVARLDSPHVPELKFVVVVGIHMNITASNICRNITESNICMNTTASDIRMNITASNICMNIREMHA